MSNEHGASPHKLRIIPAFLASATSKDGHAICNEMTESGEFITASGRSESLHSPNAGPACNRGRIRDSVTAGETAHICLQQRQRYAAMSTDRVLGNNPSPQSKKCLSLTSSGCVAPFFRNDKHKPSNAGIDAYECNPYGVKAMTNESISGFLNSIAEAKRAFDAEPDYQQRIRNQEQQIEGMRQTVASREQRIHELKQVENELTAKLRSVEAERDDAGFRAVESDEKVQTLLMVVRDFVRNGLEAISAIEGHEQIIVSKESMADIHKVNSEQSRSIDNLTFSLAEREEELQRLKDEMAKAQEQLTRPFASATPSSQGEGTDPWSDLIKQTNAYVSEHGEYPQGQREADPTASASDPIPQGLGQSEKSPIGEPQVGSQEGQSEGPFASTIHTEPQNASSHSVENTDAVASSVSQSSPPERNRDRSTFFKGRKYFDVTYFVPLHQWLNDGGSREDYYWRPAEANVPLPEANRASHQS